MKEYYIPLEIFWSHEETLAPGQEILKELRMFYKSKYIRGSIYCFAPVDLTVQYLLFDDTVAKEEKYSIVANTIHQVDVIRHFPYIRFKVKNPSTTASAKVCIFLYLE